MWLIIVKWYLLVALGSLVVGCGLLIWDRWVWRPAETSSAATEPVLGDILPFPVDLPDASVPEFQPMPALEGTLPPDVMVVGAVTPELGGWAEAMSAAVPASV